MMKDKFVDLYKRSDEIHSDIVKKMFVFYGIGITYYFDFSGNKNFLDEDIKILLALFISIFSNILINIKLYLLQV